MPCISCCPETKCEMPSLNIVMGLVFVPSAIVFLWTLFENGVEDISMEDTLDDGKGMASFIGLGFSAAYAIYLACKQANGFWANFIARANGEILDGDNAGTRYSNL